MTYRTRKAVLALAVALAVGLFWLPSWGDPLPTKALSQMPVASSLQTSDIFNVSVYNGTSWGGRQATFATLIDLLDSAPMTLTNKSLSWGQLTGTPTTLAGYGIADGMTAAAVAASYQPLSEALNTVAGNGSAYYLNRSNHTGTQAWSTLTSKPTTLAGYGIADGITAASVAAGYQPLDSDLTSIAAVSTTSFGRGLLATADAAALRSMAGLEDIITGMGVAASYQPLSAALTTVAGNGSEYYLDRSNHTGTQAWSTITSTPTTLAGYGIVDCQPLSEALNTVAGNGSAYYLNRSNHTGTQAWSTITSKPTTLAGYGIADGITASEAAAAYQPLDSDLTSIAAVSTTSFGRGLLATADAAALRSTAGLTDTTYTMASDAATGANTFGVDTGISFAAEANSIYYVQLIGRVQSVNTNTGYAFYFDVGTGNEVTFTGGGQLANTGTCTMWSQTASGGAAGVTTGVPTSSAIPVMGQGLIRTNDATTVTLKYRSETNAVTTALAGTLLLVRKL